MPAAATATGSTDDSGRRGGAFTRLCRDSVSVTGPWPGRAYSVPLFAALVVTTAVCGLVLHRTARRPAAEPQDEDRRRTGARDVVAAWGFLVPASLTGIALAVFGALDDLVCPTALTRAVSWVMR